MDETYLQYRPSQKHYDKKARSIVAMLFWEWRKAERLCKIYEDYVTARGERRYYAERAFYKAYKMLKDNR